MSAPQEPVLGAKECYPCGGLRVVVALTFPRLLVSP